MAWTFNIVWSNSIYNYQKSKTLDCKDIGIRKSEFLSKTQLLCPPYSNMWNKKLIIETLLLAFTLNVHLWLLCCMLRLRDFKRCVFNRRVDQKLELLYFESLVYTYDSSHTLQRRNNLD